MSEAMNLLSQLDLVLEKIDDQRDAIIALHQQVMNKASKGVSENSKSYEERIMAREMMTHPRRPLDLDVFSLINPCGYAGLEVTQTKDQGIDATMPELAIELTEHITGLFGYDAAELN